MSFMPHRRIHGFWPALCLVSILNLLLAGDLASQVSSSRPASSTDTFTLSGSVVNSVTGEPIGRALVQINGYQQRTGFSDSNGHFTFDGLHAGRVNVTAQKPGYFSERELPGATFLSRIDIGASNNAVTLKLSPQGAISGRVTDAAEQPLESVPVRLLNRTVREGRKRWESRGSQQTDEDGRFRFANLMPGDYYVAAGPSLDTDRLLAEGEKPKSGYASVYYPGVPDLSAASPIQLIAGQQAQADFSLSAVPVYHVVGFLTGYPPGQGVGLQVSGLSGDDLSLQTRFDMDSGRFEILGVPAGSYLVKAFSQAGPRRLYAGTRINVTLNIENAQLTLAPVPSIPIIVRLESRTSSNQGTAALDPARHVSVHLAPLDPSGGDVYSSERNSAGTSIVLDNVDPGKYSVDIRPFGEWYVQSAQYGQTNLLHDDMSVNADGQVFPIEIVLRDDPASLTGTVKSSEGNLPQATVLVIPESGSKGTTKTTKVAPEGSFTIGGLPPGQYLVFAFDNVEGIEYGDADTLEPYASQAAHVTLSASQRAQVSLDLIHRENGN